MGLAYETSIKIGSVIRISTLDVSESTREGVLEEMEHGEKLSRRPFVLLVFIQLDASERDSHEHVVAEETSNHRVVHDGLVRLVLEVGLPSVGEMRSGPPLKLLEFLLSRSDLDAGLDTVGGKRSSTLQIPFVKYFLCL